ncbi:MAG TPA: T9SS type A sorting domain-containing protein [Flavobacteriales bacterium]|nr:T9SS type A sorting domain-containing protein [Flavobacteriales bacterium]
MKKIIYATFILLNASTALAQPISFAARGVGGGGALFSPSINPANPNEYYIACDMSELFHSTNLGASYNQVDFNQFLGGHNSKVCFTSTTGLLYSISYINDIGTPVKSTDNGVTWTTLAGNPDPSEDTYYMYVDYNNSNRVVIAYYGEVYFSSNGGSSFTSIHTDGTGNGCVVGGAFFDGLNIYLGTNEGVLVSTNGGTTWNMVTISGIPSTDAIWSFAAGKSGGTTRFFCLTGDAADVYVGLQGSDYWDFMTGVYSCDYGSTNWVSKLGGLTVGVDFPMFVGMAENNINTVYLGGSNNAGEPAIYKTTNAGTSWTNTFQTTNNQNIFTGWSGDGGDRGWGYGECLFGMSVCATDANYVLVGDFGFPHYTSDGGANWHQAYVDVADQHAINTSTPQGDNYHSIGIENTTCWQVHWSDASNMWACYSDIRGCRSTDGGDTWSFNYTGNTANSSYRIVEDASGTLYMGTSAIHDMYQSTRLTDAILDATDGAGRILYSTDNAATWTQLMYAGHPVFWLELDPTNANRAYASIINHAGAGLQGGVYRCNDLNNLATSTWTWLGNPPRTEGHPACLKVLDDGTLVATYSGRRNASGTFTASSGVYTYNPTSGAWTDLSDPGMEYWTKDVIVDPNDPTQNTWYVCVFSGWGGPPNGLGGIYKTTDRGINWTKLTGTTLDRVTSLTFNPTNANEVFITTEFQGMWMSSNINAGTPTFSAVTNYPFKQPERIFFNPNDNTEMWVTSFGNGMKMGNITGSGTPEFENNNQLSVYPNPANESMTILNAQANSTFFLYNQVGEKVADYKLSGGNNTIDISKIPVGMYIAKMGERTTKLLVQR